MFKFRDDIDKKDVLKGRTQKYIADSIGLGELTLSLILNRENTTKQTTAFAITKALDENAEIEDFFIRKEK